MPLENEIFLPPPPEPTGGPIPLYLFWFYRLLIWIFSGVFLATIALAGIKFITSLGEPGKIKEARGQLLKSFGALLLVILIPFILKIIYGEQIKIVDLFKLTPPSSVQPKEIALPQKGEGVYVLDSEGKVHHLFPISYPSLAGEIIGGLDLVGKIDKIEIVSDSFNYSVVLFSQENFLGYCLEIPPPPFGKSKVFSLPEKIKQNYPPHSLVILKFKTFPEGKITFYQKPFYNWDGQVPGGFLEIKGPTGWQLFSRYQLLNVPEREKKCLLFDMAGNCLRKGLLLGGRICQKMDGAGNCLYWGEFVDGFNSIKIPANLSLLIVAREEVAPGKYNEVCQLFFDKGGKYSVANIKNEFVRFDYQSGLPRHPWAFKILPGTP